MRKIKALVIIALAAVIGFSMLSCPTDGGGKGGKGGNGGNGDNGGNIGDGGNPQPGKEGKPDVVVLNVSKSTEWDWLVVGADGSSMFFNADKTSGIPTRLFLKPKKNSDNGFSYTFKENGLPDVMVVNGNILVFGNFNGYTFDVAVIYPDGTTEYHYGIETDENFDTWDARFISGRSVYNGARSVSARFLDDEDMDTKDKLLAGLSFSLELLGHGLGIITCASSFTNPASATGCFIYVVSLQAKMAVTAFTSELEDWAAGAGNLTIDGVNLVIDALGCAGKSVQDCISAAGGLASMLIGDDLQDVAGKIAELYAAKEEMEKGPVYVNVNFHANGGSGAVPDSMTVERGSYITIPSGDGLSRAGYIFTGWDSSPGYRETNWGASTPISRNTSFYAMWKQILPGVVTGVSAKAASSDSVTVSWNPVSGASGYNVYRGKSALGTYDKVALPSSTFYIDNGLSANTTYYYKVSYYEPGGESAQSASVYVKTMAVNAGTPVTFSALTANGGVLTNTSTLTLTFSAAIPGLSAADITLFGVDGVQKGTLSGSGPEYTLGVSGINQSGTLSVSVLKTGYNISGSLKSTAVHYREQGKGIGAYEMVFVESGTFQLGKALGTVTGQYYVDVTPVSNVTLSSFYIGRYEVTQSQWFVVMGTTQEEVQKRYYVNNQPQNGYYGRGDGYPIYSISWYYALVFCNRLSVMEGLTPAYRINNSTNPDSWGTVPGGGSSEIWDAVTVDDNANGYRLPTEAQWEYAAKGGNPLAPGWVGYTYAGSDNPDDVAWYSGNTSDGAKPVGTKAPNGLGIYDMSGNVSEWCWDWGSYQNDTRDYTSEDKTDPTGRPSGINRISRNGSWMSDARGLPSVYREYMSGAYVHAPGYATVKYGIRLVRPAE